MDPISVWFDSEFWPIFPQHKAKAAAVKAARVHLRIPATRDQALAALKAQLPELNSREPSKRPYPATWINGRRWEDEPDPLFVATNGHSGSAYKKRSFEESVALELGKMHREGNL